MPKHEYGPPRDRLLGNTLALVALGQAGPSQAALLSQGADPKLATRPKQGTHTLTAPPLRGRRESAALGP